MKQWSDQLENEIAFLIKDWLKNNGKTQSDLGKSMNLPSSRLNSILEVLKKEYQRTGIPGIAEYLCKIEQNWFTSSSEIKMDVKDEDPFNQLDLLMEKFKDVQKE